MKKDSNPIIPVKTIRPAKPPQYYDTAAACPPYLPLYSAALEYLKHVPPDEPIIDLGCGPGTMAKILFDAGHRNYLGIDFSPGLLAKARQIVPDAPFLLADLRFAVTHEIFKDSHVFVLLEVLEHLTDDRMLLASIPTDSKVLLSVPNFDSKSHVRRFQDPQSVIDRYSKWLDFTDSTTLAMWPPNKIFLFDTIRRNSKPQ